MWLCWRRIEYNRTFSLKAQHYDFFVRLLADRPPTSISTRRTCGHHGANHGSRFLIVAINTRCLDESMLAGTRGCQAVVIRRLRDGWPITGRPDDHRHTTYNSLALSIHESAVRCSESGCWAWRRPLGGWSVGVTADEACRRRKPGRWVRVWANNRQRVLAVLGSAGGKMSWVAATTDRSLIAPRLLPPSPHVADTVPQTIFYGLFLASTILTARPVNSAPATLMRTLSSRPRCCRNCKVGS